MADNLQLLVSGRSHSGWESIRVTRSMENCAGSFSLSVSERWPDVEAPRQIRNGEKCELILGDEALITGYVDQVESDLDASHHVVSVAGRDKVADLIDCSAVVKGGQWRGLRIEQLAARLAAPFDIPVSADVDTGKPLASFALQTGESVFEAILRAARIRALLLVSDGRGGLRLTRAGAARVGTTLETGVNLLQCTVKSDWRDRFSQYTMLGQAPGNDYFNGEAAAHMSATADDPDVSRKRPLVMIADSPDTAGSLKDRVLWEANLRAARSLSVTARVQGWRHSAGLWAPNMLVRVISKPQHLDDVLLIASVEFGLSDSEGTTTTLVLTRADAFSLLPMRAPEAGAASFWTLPKPEVAK